MSNNNKHKMADKLSNDFVTKEQMIKNLEDNIREAEISMEFAFAKERDILKDKIQRRQHEIQRLKDEPLS